MRLDELQSAILRNIQERDALASKAQTVYRHEAEADHEKELAHARAYLKIKEGTVEARKAECMVTIADQRLTARLAEAESQAMKDRLKAYESTISALQSLLRLHISEADALRFGQRGSA